MVMHKAVFLDRDGTLIRPLKPRMVKTRWVDAPLKRDKLRAMLAPPAGGGAAAPFGPVLNDCVIRPSEIKLYTGVISGLRKLQAAGYKLIIITNQSVVGRGVITERQLQQIHKRLVTILKRKGVAIDAVYYCPHHPTEARIKKYLRKCNCRKPAPGLLFQAAKEHHLNLKQSYFIGDSDNDARSARAGKVKFIRITPYRTFLKAVDIIID